MAQAPAPDEHARQAEMAELVATAISLLPETHREAVVLKDVEDMSLEDASRVLQLELPAFKSRLHRAREQLKANLATLLRDAPAGSAVTDCPGLRQALVAQEQGAEIDRAACRAIEEHLTSCERCSREMGHLRDAARLCRRLPGDRVPAPVQRAVRAALNERIGGRSEQEATLGQ